MRLADAFAVAGVAFLVRLWLFLDVRDAPYWNVPIMDEQVYVELARGLLSGIPPAHGAYYVAPGYAYFLALVFSAGGSPLAVKLVQALSGILSSLLVYGLARRWFDHLVAVGAGLAWALYPAALLQEVLLLKSSLTVLCVLAALALIGLPRRAGALHWILAGLCFGAAALLRGELVVLALILALAAWLARLRAWPAAPRPAAPLLLGLALCGALAIPTLQNWRHAHDRVVLAYGGGTNFYIGNNPQADGSYVPLRPDRSDVRMEEDDANRLAADALGHTPTPSEVSRFWWRRGFEWWREHPWKALQLAAKKCVLLWGPHEIADVLSTPLAARWVVLLRNPLLVPGVVLPLALAGLWMTRRRRDLWPLHAFLLGSQLALVPFFLFERFRLHLIAASMPFAAAAVDTAWSNARVRRWRRLGLGLLATVSVAILLSLPRVPRDEEALRINIGEMLFDAGRYQEALREYDAVLSGAPGAWRVDINRANALAGLGRLEEALQALERVLPRLYAEGQRTGHPSTEEIVYSEELAGDIEHTRNHLPQAARHYQAALTLAPPTRQADLRRKLSTCSPQVDRPEGLPVPNHGKR